MLPRPQLGIAPLAEMQGLYGPYAFSELLLQKLWRRREYAAEHARTADGRRVVVLHPGRWNRGGGPDFLQAIIELDGERRRGDIEVHLRAGDWDHHHHAADPAYDGVMLHVVLFPSAAVSSLGRNGTRIPILTLLPLLWHDLEEYAADEAVAALLDRPDYRIAAELVHLPAAELWALLRSWAERRWQSKVQYAARRIERLGWTMACHATTLEVLGYRQNRAAMLRVAEAWPLKAWADERANPERIYAELRDHWKVQGVRPANQPRRRLQQYAEVVRGRPDWPNWLERHASTVWPLSVAEEEPAQVARLRRALGFPAKWQELLTSVAGTSFHATRADTLIGDAWLPLVAAKGAIDERTAWNGWWAGYPGDLPDAIFRGMQDLGLSGTRETPTARGPTQGILGWLMERELNEQIVSKQGAGPGA